MRLSYDETHLFTISEDGCLWIYKVVVDKSIESNSKKENTLSAEIMISREDLNERNKIIGSLKTQVEVK